MMPMFSDLEHDALTELINLGVGRSATRLREMVGEQVFLSLPSVALVGRQRAIDLLREREPASLVAVHQAMSGDITGAALLVIPDSKSLELVRAVTGGELPPDEIVDLEQEALAEVGNVILNGCVGTIANALERSFSMSFPKIMRGQADALFVQAAGHSDDVVLFLQIDFGINRRDIRGYISLVVDLASLVTLKSLLAEFIARGS